jgi:hypothetical protein
MNSGSGLPRPSRDDGANAETSGWPRGALAALIRSQPRVSCTGPRVRSQPDDLACRVVALLCLPCAEVRHFPCAPFGCVRGANFGSIRRRRIRCTRGLAGVDGGVNPRKSGDDRKAGRRFAACDQPLLAIYRSDANGCPVALCQRRQPPKAGAVGQCLQRVAGQSSWTIKNDGWFRIAKVRLTRERPYAKTVWFSELPHRRLRADSRRRQQLEASRFGRGLTAARGC